MTKTEKLIDDAFAIRSHILELASQLDEKEAAIIALGAGKHTGSVESHEVSVIPAQPDTVRYKLDAKNTTAAFEIAGDHAGKLFDRHITFEPCKAFEEVAPKLVGKTVWKKLAALLAKPVSGKRAYLLYPKTPKS